MVITFHKENSNIENIPSSTLSSIMNFMILLSIQTISLPLAAFLIKLHLFKVQYSI